MPMEVFSDEWARACRARINEHEGYRAAAADWSDDVVLVMTEDAAAGVPVERAFLLELRAGRCEGVRPAAADEPAAYVLAADPAAWREILEGGLDPVGALMRGRLRLRRGNLFALARYAGAATALVEAAGGVDAVFPGAAAG